MESRLLEVQGTTKILRGIESSRNGTTLDEAVMISVITFLCRPSTRMIQLDDHYSTYVIILLAPTVCNLLLEQFSNVFNTQTDLT